MFERCVSAGLVLHQRRTTAEGSVLLFALISVLLSSPDYRLHALSVLVFLWFITLADGETLPDAVRSELGEQARRWSERTVTNAVRVSVSFCRFIRHSAVYILATEWLLIWWAMEMGLFIAHHVLGSHAPG